MSLEAGEDSGASRATFPRARRLKRRRLIRPLFQRNAPDVGRLRVGAVRVLYRIVPRADTGLDTPVQVGFAPGRTRTAVDRNRLRRAMRETFRQHQGPLLRQLADRPSETLTMFILVQSRDANSTDALRRDLPRALAKLANRIDPASDAPAAP
ncbi:MAG: ribonuclease P protein component [Rubricoccaceae bacterium]